MNVKRLLCFAVTVVSLVLVPMGIASAHDLANDRGVSGLFHSDPDDSLIAGKPARLLFVLTIAGKTLASSDCGCSVVFVKDGKTLLRSPLTGESLDITAPRPGSYSVTLIGTKPYAFQLDYKTEVVPPAHTPWFDNRGTQALLFSLASIVMLAIIARRQIADGGRYKQS